MANLTIKDIAKICGVGISTVSRAINDDPGINQNTRKRILKVIKETFPGKVGEKNATACQIAYDLA